VTREEKAAWAIEQLTLKQAELDRLPLKDDFDEVTRSRIKAFLGPWPRALEKAGLKEAKEVPPKSKKRKKPSKSKLHRPTDAHLREQTAAHVQDRKENTPE